MTSTSLTFVTPPATPQPAMPATPKKLKRPRGDHGDRAREIVQCLIQRIKYEHEYEHEHMTKITESSLISAFENLSISGTGMDTSHSPTSHSPTGLISAFEDLSISSVDTTTCREVSEKN